MKRIGILSDTHGFLDDQVFIFFKACDEIWHAGDFGDYSIVERLEAFKPLRGVYGNIDGRDIRSRFPEKLHFVVEQTRVFIQHIGGYPGKYAPGVKKQILDSGAMLFISGHSHITKIMYDEVLHCLHINPGAAGRQGWQKVRTLVRLIVDGKNMKDCEIMELDKKSGNIQD